MFKKTVSVLSYFAAAGIVFAMGSALTTARCEDLAAKGKTFDLAIGLSGSMESQGKLGPDTALRAQTTVDLFKDGVVNNILFSGGVTENRVHPAASTQMAEIAISQGVPADKITTENNSRSTLENARNSVPLFDRNQSFVVVTDGYHLWRSWLSFAWAGNAPDGLCKSGSFRPDGFQMSARLVVREALALWYNIGRASIWSLADLMGLEPHLGSSFLH